MSKVITVRHVGGVPVVEFVPTPAMKMFAITAFCDPSVSGKDWKTICRAAGIPEIQYRKMLAYEPHFSEWLESERVRLGGKNKKAALEYIGMSMAMEGDAQFWKPLAIREGVIAADRLDIGAALPANLTSFDGMSDADIQALHNSAMAALRQEADPGTIPLVETPDGWRPEGDSNGAAPVPEGSVVLAPAVGADGERPLSELDDF